ncbi:MAG: response regulator [Bacteroidota bacterium]
MENYKILVVEDEELAADRMEMLIDKLGYVCQNVVDNSSDALAALAQEVPDLVLMDINIQGAYDGIELADMMHAQHSVPIIFVTSLHDDQTFRRIARTNPVAYIVKPFSDVQLQRTIELIFKQISDQRDSIEEDIQVSIQADQADYFFIKKGKMLEKLPLSEVLYLEADGRYSVIHLAQQKYLVRLPLKELCQVFHQLKLIQVHRSYFVPKNKIDRINLEDFVVEIAGHQIPLSRREKDAVLERLRVV